MGGGVGRGLDFGNTWGSGRLPMDTGLPDSVSGEDWHIGRSLGAAAMNYNVSDPRSGRAYRFIEGTSITDVEVFAGKGTRNKLSPKVSHGLSEQVGGRPRDWQHVKGIGTVFAVSQLSTICRRAASAGCKRHCNNWKTNF